MCALHFSSVRSFSLSHSFIIIISVFTQFEISSTKWDKLLCIFYASHTKHTKHTNSKRVHIHFVCVCMFIAILLHALYMITYELFAAVLIGYVFFYPFNSCSRSLSFVHAWSFHIQFPAEYGCLLYACSFLVPAFFVGGSIEYYVV